MQEQPLKRGRGSHIEIRQAAADGREAGTDPRHPGLSDTEKKLFIPRHWREWVYTHERDLNYI